MRASPHGGLSSGLAAARYHTVAPERRCASQQKLRADVADGSIASDQDSPDPASMYAMPPIATEFPRRGETTLSANRVRSEEHTSELQSLRHLVCRLLLEKKKIIAHRHGGGRQRVRPLLGVARRRKLCGGKEVDHRDRGGERPGQGVTTRGECRHTAGPGT